MSRTGILNSCFCFLKQDLVSSFGLYFALCPLLSALCVLHPVQRLYAVLELSQREVNESLLV